jgi:hypothetical protein
VDSSMARIWILTRVVASIFLVGFVFVGVVFAFTPSLVMGVSIDVYASFWHSLSLAFMATISLLVLLILWDPGRYWVLFMPLGIGKTVSFISFFYWYLRFGLDVLLMGFLIDISIAIISIALYLYFRYILSL